MRALDMDEDGTVSKAEFRKVLPLLGFDAGGTPALDALFDTFDADASGTVEYAELARLLQGARAPSAPAPAAEAAPA
jgi:Ca2+-binding EF-hand superfamily protein